MSMFDEENLGWSVPLTLFAISLLLVLSCFFWLNNAPCTTNQFGECTSFDAHGFSWITYLIFSFILLEIIFCYLILKNKRYDSENIFEYTLKYKFYALCLTALFYMTIIPLGFYLYKWWNITLWIFGIACVIGVYYLINVGITKLFGGVNTTKKIKKKSRKSKKTNRSKK